MNLLHCPNCAAPITGNKCEYCGSDFSKGVNVDFESNESIGVLKIGGEECKVYISNTTFHSLPGSLYAVRDEKGMLRRVGQHIYRREWTLIEYIDKEDENER